MFLQSLHILVVLSYSKSTSLTGACTANTFDMYDFESVSASKSKLLILIFIRSDPTTPSKNEISIINDR